MTGEWGLDLWRSCPLPQGSCCSQVPYALQCTSPSTLWLLGSPTNPSTYTCWGCRPTEEPGPPCGPWNRDLPFRLDVGVLIPPTEALLGQARGRGSRNLPGLPREPPEPCRGLPLRRPAPHPAGAGVPGCCRPPAQQPLSESWEGLGTCPLCLCPSPLCQRVAGRAQAPGLTLALRELACSPLGQKWLPVRLITVPCAAKREGVRRIPSAPGKGFLGSPAQALQGTPFVTRREKDSFKTPSLWRSWDTSGSRGGPEPPASGRPSSPIFRPSSRRGHCQTGVLQVDGVSVGMRMPPGISAPSAQYCADFISFSPKPARYPHFTDEKTEAWRSTLPKAFELRTGRMRAAILP